MTRNERDLYCLSADLSWHLSSRGSGKHSTTVELLMPQVPEVLDSLSDLI